MTSAIMSPDNRATPAVDEEHFRLLTGFNDIFVSIAAVILLVAVGWIGNTLPPHIEASGPSPFAGLFVAGTAWGLAEFFTRKRRMALAQHPAAARLRRRRVRHCGLRPRHADRRIDARSRTTTARRRASCSRAAPRSRRSAPGSTGAGSGCRSRSPPAPPRLSGIVLGLIVAQRSAHDATRVRGHHARLRLAARHRRVPVRDVRGTRPIRAARRAVPTSPSGCICSPRR